MFVVWIELDCTFLCKALFLGVRARLRKKERFHQQGYTCSIFFKQVMNQGRAVTYQNSESTRHTPAVTNTTLVEWDEECHS